MVVALGLVAVVAVVAAIGAAMAAVVVVLAAVRVQVGDSPRAAQGEIVIARSGVVGVVAAVAVAVVDLHQH